MAEPEMTSADSTPPAARGRRLFATAAAAVSGRFLLVVVAISELACLAVLAAIIL